MKALADESLTNEGITGEGITDKGTAEGNLVDGSDRKESAGQATGQDEADRYEPKAEEVCITIPGLDKAYTLLWVSDMHICTGGNDADVSADHAEEVEQRHEMFCSASGRQSQETWNLLSDQIDDIGADYVIFGADMVDYASRENLAVLQDGISKISTPWMYIRADHDYARWYGSMEIEQMRELQREIAPQNKIWVERFDGFTLVGLDNTTSAVSEETLAQFQEVYEEGIPIILCTHVPFDTGSEDARKLAEISKECWGDRVLCWGDGDECNTAKAPTMKAILEMIMAPDSPVCAVLAGHLHTSWDGSLTDTCRGHVFSAAFEDSIGIIKVSG